MADNNIAASGELFKSYAVVFAQLQDLVRKQTSLIVKLQCKADRQTDQVAREEYDAVKLQLENETLSHLQTKAKLLSKEQELQFALSDIDTLSKELEEEKNLFHKICSELLTKAEEKDKENNILLEKCSEIKEMCGNQDDILTVKDVKINDLKSRLAKQTRNQRMMANEAELQLQQERFLNEQSIRNTTKKVGRLKHVKRK